MGTIENELWDQMSQAPDAEYQVIVRTASDPALVAEDCASRGMRVGHLFHFLSALSLTGTGGALMELAESPHVTSIEPDSEVSI